MHVLLETTRLAVVACTGFVLLVTARSGANTRSRHSENLQIVRSFLIPRMVLRGQILSWWSDLSGYFLQRPRPC